MGIPLLSSIWEWLSTNPITSGTIGSIIATIICGVFVWLVVWLVRKSRSNPKGQQPSSKQTFANQQTQVGNGSQATISQNQHHAGTINNNIVTRDPSAAVHENEQQERSLRERLAGTTWRWNDSHTTMTYEVDGRVKCNAWGHKTGTWNVESEGTIKQTDATADNEWLITFAPDFKRATCVHQTKDETATLRLGR